MNHYALCMNTCFHSLSIDQLLHQELPFGQFPLSLTLKKKKSKEKTQPKAELLFFGGTRSSLLRVGLP